MSKRDTALFVIVIVLVIASSILLYRGINNQPLDLITPTVSDEDVIIRNEIDRLDARLKKAIRKLEEGGELEELIESEQYKELTKTKLSPIIIGPHGRDNPFLKY